MDNEKAPFNVFLLNGSHALLGPGDEEPGTSPGWTVRRYTEGKRLLLSKRQCVTTAAVPYRIQFIVLAFYECGEDIKPEENIWHLMYNGRTLEDADALKNAGPLERAKLAQAIEEFLDCAVTTNDDPEQLRGPQLFEDGDWIYTCEQKGDFAKFEGKETVLYRDELVYEGSFKGKLNT